MKKFVLIAMVLALVAGAVALVLAEIGPQLPGIGPEEARAAGRTHRSGRLEGGAVDRRMAAVAPDGEAVASAERVSGDESEPGKGSVEGTVFDQWRVLPERRVVLSRRAFGEVGAIRRAETDADGFYRIDGLDAGTWYAQLAEDDPRFPPGDRIARSMGEVEVVADRVTHFDLHVTGERTLGGKLLLDMDDPELGGEGGVGLFLELRTVLEPVDIVGRGKLVISKHPFWDDGQVEQEGQDGFGEAPSKLEMGCFRFGGLEARAYTLRAYLDPGSDFFVERPVDLVDGDVELAPEVLELDEFWDNVFRNKLR